MPREEDVRARVGRLGGGVLAKLPGGAEWPWDALAARDPVEVLAAVDPAVNPDPLEAPAAVLAALPPSAAVVSVGAVEDAAVEEANEAGGG